MEAESFDRSLRTFCRRLPFQPFTVELVSGTRFQIEHPEALAFNAGTAVYISPDGPPSIFDHRSISQLIGAMDSASASAA